MCTEETSCLCPVCRWTTSQIERTDTHTHTCTCTCNYHSQNWLVNSGSEPAGGNKAGNPIAIWQWNTSFIYAAPWSLSAVNTHLWACETHDMKEVEYDLQCRHQNIHLGFSVTRFPTLTLGLTRTHTYTHACSHMHVCIAYDRSGKSRSVWKPFSARKATQNCNINDSLSITDAINTPPI